MPTRERLVDRGRVDARAITAEIAREVKLARLGHSLAQADVARAAGISQSTWSRIERGQASNLTILRASSLLAVVGLRLHARAYPAGSPLRDDAHGALLARLRGRLHPSLRWRTEVPLALKGDLRAWDATIAGERWSLAVEAEMRPRDLQTLCRRIALKQRDGEMPAVVLLLADTRHNRELVRDHGDDLRVSFPLPGARALELLRAGANPGASSIIRL
ncbi:MAG TPA: helix-turn-helix transcriptional regulator [Candidatus Limnocylindrales bacterium]|nr:helix-turn-helix transcriptional regulator [Candidatus Limnocylindrales bacterium]